VRLLYEKGGWHLSALGGCGLARGGWRGLVHGGRRRRRRGFSDVGGPQRGIVGSGHVKQDRGVHLKIIQDFSVTFRSSTNKHQNKNTMGFEGS